MYYRERKVNTFNNYISDYYPNVPFDDYVISVKNLRNLTPEQRKEMKPNQIIIDRSSPLGNPFHMSRLPDGKLDESTRDATIDSYKDYFYEMMKAFGRYGHGITYLTAFARRALNAYSEEYPRKVSPAQLGYLFIRWMRYIFKILAQYKHIELWCWCAPKKCHAMVIIDYFMRHVDSLRRYTYKHRLNNRDEVSYASFGNGNIWQLDGNTLYHHFINGSYGTSVMPSTGTSICVASSEEISADQCDVEAANDEVAPPEGEATPIPTNERVRSLIDRIRNRNSEDEEHSAEELFNE